MAARTGTFEVEKWYLCMGVLNSVCQLQTDNRLNDQFTRYMHENKPTTTTFCERIPCCPTYLVLGSSFVIEHYKWKIGKLFQ